MEIQKIQKEKPYNPLILAKTISFRVSEYEYNKLKILLQQFNLNKSDTMRKLIYESTVGQTYTPLNN